jgi:hypothetical protein
MEGVEGTTIPMIKPDTDDYREFLDGASVVLIGGADNYRDVYNHGEVVVRTNNHWQRQAGACDIIYHTVCGGDLSPESNVAALPEEGLSFLFLNLVDTEYEVGSFVEPRYKMLADGAKRNYGNDVGVGLFAQGEWLEANPYGAEHEWLNQLHKKYNCKLLTGLVALADLLRYDPYDIFVCGMDLYKNDGAPTREGWRHSHKLDGNIQFLIDSLDDSRVTYDEPLMDALHPFL